MALWRIAKTDKFIVYRLKTSNLNINSYMSMKTKIISFFLVLASSIGSLFAAQQIGDLFYDLDEATKTASVISASSYGIVSVVIPATVSYGSTYRVTRIESSAFYNCSLMTKVTIPNSVTSIESQAFYNCYSLTRVTIPNSVTYIGNYAFSGCSSLTSPVYNTHVFAFMPTSYSGVYTIPDGIESIVGGAFRDCSGLTSLTIPISVTSIGEAAFSGCSGLTSVIVENGNTTFDSRNNCNAIITTASNTLIVGCQNTIIPNSVTSIERYAFQNHSGLTSVTIPNSVTSIGTHAFSNCIGLTSVTIPNSVTSIGYNAFNNVPNIAYSGTATGSPWGARCINGYVDGYLVFSDEAKATLVACSSTATGEMVIPNSATSIENSAFSGCSGLTRVTIPNSVTSIKSYAFAYCSRLTSVTMQGETPPTGYSNMFYQSNKLSDIYVPCGTLDAYKRSWSSYASEIKYLPLAYAITGQVNISDAGSITIPTNICEPIYATPNYGYHFTQWSDGVTDNPRTIELTQDTTLIAEFAVDTSGSCGNDLALTWQYDSDKKALTISGTGDLTANKRYGLEADKEMTTLVVDDGVGIIGDSAFANIPTLSTVKIGKDVRKIQDYAFGNCYNLASIYNYRPTPATIVANTFEEVDKYACTLYVLPGSVEMYRSAVGWSDFYNILPIPASAIEEIISENSFTVSPQKIIDNGQLFILLPDGTRYSATGVKVE